MNIVITGASKGLGRAIAEKFGEDKQGHGLFLCARNSEQLRAFALELQGRFPRTNVQYFVCDMSKQEEVQAFANWFLAFNVKLDVLVNNAGQFIPGSVHNEAAGALEKMIEVNLYSAYHLTRAVLPHMMEARSGHIFNMCSIASLQAYSNGGAYSISKFALAGFSKNLREEMKPYNIKVTSVYPGASYTDSWSGSGIDPKRIMEAGDVAAMIYAASYLSPQACMEEIILRPQLGDL
ncbi:Short-chain dehydrogenase [Filimonas lacunae]|uniref:Short-chain dehydrogenase n=1 Tax=Filimonas lacunae TaxID=477680 RepID=A0A173MRJ1_9BACT|nr:SDR family oxidoreductase [Filimonas lacunae]BAV09958.1 short chain dehydrogenase [Filimonas lacunae]SIS81688.1 Short-chain dehydrogenase [Filimonas lacunae]